MNRFADQCFLCCTLLITKIISGYFLTMYSYQPYRNPTYWCSWRHHATEYIMDIQKIVCSVYHLQVMLLFYSHQVTFLDKSQINCNPIYGKIFQGTGKKFLYEKTLQIHLCSWEKCGHSLISVLSVFKGPKKKLLICEY